MPAPSGHTVNHDRVVVGSVVRKVAKRGHPVNRTLGIVVEVTGRLARVKTKDLTTTWPLALLEVVTEQETLTCSACGETYAPKPGPFTSHHCQEDK